MPRLLSFLGLLLLLPLVIPFMLGGLIAAAAFDIYRRAWLLLYCWTHAESAYLVCSRRRDWGPLLQNNVIPALPQQVSAVWTETTDRSDRVLRAIRLSQINTAKPFLILVTRFGLRWESLNQTLQNWKEHGKEDVETRIAMRQLIERTLSNLGHSAVSTVQSG